MCGIAGEMRFDSAPPSREAVQRMMDRLQARGPDGSGMHVAGAVALGHRRLAVIDATPRSTQPMSTDDGALTIVYNGALYEFRQLRAELSRLGHRFVSEGDTEVVLAAYRQWGPRCVEHLRGMFAFAVLEASGRVFLARDRMGIKPLYWSEGRARFRFASSLPAIIAAGDLDSRLDRDALHQYLTLHGIVVPPATILQGVRKLAPGTTMMVEPDGRRRHSAYWRYQRAPQPELSAAQWTTRLRGALQAAVARRQVADTDVGVLLSGGLDSSLIVALLHAHGVRDIPTFSVGFEAIGNEPGDEFAWSDAVATRFGTRHTKLRVSTKHMVDALPHALASMSEPMVSHDNVGFFALGQTVAHHAKAVQSGQGADELFGGYHWHARLLRDGGGRTAYASAFFDRSQRALSQLLTPPWTIADQAVDRAVSEHFADHPDSTIDGTLQCDAALMLPGDPVTRLDNQLMASGVEARTPFLDEEVVDIARRIPAPLTVPGGKAVLKAVARQLLPAAWVDRPKGYFPVPALRWIAGDVHTMLTDWLGSTQARQRGIFNPKTVARLLTRDDPLTPLGGSTLWQVATLEAWLQTNGL